MSDAKKETILEEAQRLVFGTRTESYGHPLDNFTVIGDLWTAYLEARYPEIRDSTIAITAEDVGLMMTLLKIARQAHKPGRDNLTDGAGYLGCVERVQDERKRRGEEEFFKISSALKKLEPKAPEDLPHETRDDVWCYACNERSCQKIVAHCRTCGSHTMAMVDKCDTCMVEDNITKSSILDVMTDAPRPMCDPGVAYHSYKGPCPCASCVRVRP